MVRFILILITAMTTSFTFASGCSQWGNETVTEPVSFEKSAVSLSRKKLTLNVGDTKRLKLKNLSDGAEVKWTSSDKEIVRVSKKGKVRALSPGKAKITARTNGEKYVCTVTVKKASEQDISNMTLVMTIDGKEIPVKWENNDSVNALKSLATSELKISMSKYGGFEQVGRIGTSITKNDRDITTTPGDIVLYSGNQMVIFYGENTWDYTMLGHIEGYTEAELEKLLGNKDVTVSLTLK